MSLEIARSLRAAGRHEEAKALLERLAAERPNDAAVQYEAACAHDYLGLEAEAVPYYVAALEGDLDPSRLRGAFLGLGSTYRTLGRHREAEETLRRGLERFPDARELKVFLAMVDHNLGRSKQAVEALLALLAETSEDEGIRSYRRAIAFYAKDVDRTWT